MHKSRNALSFPLTRNPWLPALALILVLQLVLIAVVYWPAPAPADSDASLFPDFDPAAVRRVTITDGAGFSMVLARLGDGWVLPDQDDFPVTPQPVTSLLDKVAELKSSRLVASNPASFDRLGVGEEGFVRRLVLALENGQELTLLIGESPRSRATHVRRQDQETVYLAANLTAADAATQFASWIDTTYFSVPRDEVRSLSLTNGNGIFQFTKDDAGEWTMLGLQEGEEFNDNNLESILTILTGLIMVQPTGTELKAEYGFLAPLATVTVVTQAEGEEEVTHILRVGAKHPEAGRHYVSSSDSPFIVEVNSYSVERLLERTRQEFLAQPEAEGPAAPTPIPSQ